MKNNITKQICATVPLEFFRLVEELREKNQSSLAYVLRKLLEKGYEHRQEIVFVK